MIVNILMRTVNYIYNILLYSINSFNSTHHIGSFLLLHCDILDTMIKKSKRVRTSELLSRAQNCRRRVFSVSEDKTIIKCVTAAKFDNNWEAVAKLLPWRTPRQCRDRWTYYLSPNNNLAPFTPEEDQIIVQKVNELGTKWAVISKMMPGRSDNSIKNRWYSKLKSRCDVDDNGIYSLDPRKVVDEPNNKRIGHKKKQQQQQQIEKKHPDVVAPKDVIPNNSANAIIDLNDRNRSSEESESSSDTQSPKDVDFWDGEMIDWPVELLNFTIEPTFDFF
ncbi:hypothetical protein TRFO_10103 [Tritrichomonas foetus]|uniref:Myb-like DNA-binding domain containing protein n=1 Tax=Tritrichomonas foetus TaxID=1144522 RepID=A0A1J4JAI3_9EUKA|nr:hypothetical protein TRFO_10103 [Tritrichomonas foetus]|eukprot:OHS96182.1 hypothetical protein TRFO_10103 [Tritrichomonas foetus]